MQSMVLQRKISGKGCVRGGQCVVSNRIMKKGLAEKGTCAQRPEEVRRSRQMSGQSVPGTGRSKRGSPEVEACLMCGVCQPSKEARVTRGDLLRSDSPCSEFQSCHWLGWPIWPVSFSDMHCFNSPIAF